MFRWSLALQAAGLSPDLGLSALGLRVWGLGFGV